MAWDSKTATSRRRGNSNSGATPKAASSTQQAAIVPKSTHVSDPLLQPFLAPSFDPASYLNGTLPSLQSTGISAHGGVPLAELSTSTQTLLSQLSVHTTRLITTLTQLTDEILRSGSRLAYEVEILRGETLGLSEALTEGLAEDVQKFVPGGLESDLAPKSTQKETSTARRRASTATTPRTPVQQEIPSPANLDPPYITKLRTLTLVRSRLETVIKVFGDAMSWTFPPSEVSVTSSFLSVSAPEPGSAQHSVEEKGQQVSQALRDEIADLLLAADDPISGIEGAAKRVEELKELAIVWRGTAEERARGKFVGELAKMVEDRHKELLRGADHSDGLRQRVETLQEERESVVNEENKSLSGYGFLSQLQKLRNAS